MSHEAAAGHVPRNNTGNAESASEGSTATRPVSFTARTRAPSPKESEPDPSSAHSDGPNDPDSASEHRNAAAAAVVPLVPWVTVLIRYLGRSVVVTCLARAYLATLTFSATLDAVRFCAAGYLGPDSSYAMLEYQHGRWKQPMALQVVLCHDRTAVESTTTKHRETFVASCYPEEGWKFLAESVESLELVVDPNYD